MKAAHGIDGTPGLVVMRRLAMAAGLAFLGLDARHRAFSEQPAPPIVLQEVARERGVQFRFDSGTRGQHDLPEVMGGGVALIDADGDGWLDLFFCNGGPIVPDAGKPDLPCRFFHNDHGSFTDVTNQARAPGPRYAMGAAVGDFDKDGRDDLFVTGWRDQRLYRNVGDGRFEDVTERAGVSSGLWSTSAAFADLDGDGDLDLYVVNYLEYDPAKAPFCAAPDGKRDYCGPEDFPAQADRLYRNNGDGTFTDVLASASLNLKGGRGLGVLIADMTGDRRPDVFVANDGSPCWLFENRGDLKFVGVGAEAGVSVDGHGQALSGMGVALGDVDGDGRSDLVVSNFLDRSTILFQARGKGLYMDASRALGLWAETRGVLGFGLALEDFDGDGRLDLLQLNGHVLDRARLATPFAMRPTLLHNYRGTFVDAAGGPWFARARLGRGLAIGDLDGDGRPDAVAASLDEPAALLRNGSADAHFLTLDLRSASSPTAVGARVRVVAGDQDVMRDVVAGGSYLSSSSRMLHVGLGKHDRADRVEVAWPTGRIEHWHRLSTKGIHRLTEGTGEPVVGLKARQGFDPP